MAKYLFCLTYPETQIPTPRIFDIKNPNCDEFSIPDFTVMYMIVEADSKEAIASALLNIRLSSAFLSQFAYKEVNIVNRKIYLVGKLKKEGQNQCLVTQFGETHFSLDDFKEKGLEVIIEE